MKVFRPIVSNRITQNFGESKACQENFRGFYPLKVVSKVNGVCPPGFRSFYESLGMKGHDGLDIAAWYKEPCYFPVELETTWHAKNEVDRDGGKGVDVISDKPLALTLVDGSREYNHIKFRFWHLFDSGVYDGQVVKKGQIIGYCDSTGASTATHLHWSMKFCLPDGTAMYKNNGYNGAIDFTPWYVNEFVGTPMPQKSNVSNELSKLIFLLKNLGA